MAYEEILNGGFDFDPGAEKIRLSMGKAKRMFDEIFTKLPLAFGAGTEGFAIVVNATRTGYELVALPGGGDMLGANNLSDIASALTARGNLGLGTMAVEDVIDFATAAQGIKADNALQSIAVNPLSDLTIDVTDPQNPILDFPLASVFVDSINIDPVTKVLTLTRNLETDLTLDLSPYLSTFFYIDGYEVKKGVGTSPTVIEVGDYCKGWEGDEDVAFKVTGLPYTAVDGGGEFINKAYATRNSI